jgi:tetratricopeptide (TPR) repeat protein
VSSHYRVLGIEPQSTLQEIRDAYRRQVKEVHPDLNNGDPVSVERMKSVVRAWEVLRDPHLRAEYDRLHGIDGGLDGDGGFDYGDFLRSRGNDRESQAKLVFYDLLHDNPAEALSVYESLAESGDFELSQYLGREDFMDCAFLLAEEYESRDEYDRAFKLLSAIIRFEKQRPYFRHFMAEVYERLRTIVCIKMPGTVAPDEVIECLHQMISWDLPRKETAFCYKKAAEMYLAVGDRRRASRYLERGLALDRRLTGVKKLKEELGFFEPA